jgi:hypothetical protein
VVRLECIAAVRVSAVAPMLRPVPAGPSIAGQRTFDGITPMPAPAGRRVMQG